MPPVVDRARLPDDWPTSRGPSGFWEELGRTVATFSRLEDMLARAYFGLTGTQKFDNIEQAEAAFPQWEEKLKETLSDTLGSLTSKLKEVFEKDDRVPDACAREVVARLNEIRVWRNALCHGAWHDFEADGSVELRYFKKTKDGPERLDDRLNLETISLIRAATVDVTLNIVDLLSAAGVQFPGTQMPLGEDARIG